MGVVGASQFRASATLANTQGVAAQSSGLLDNISTSLLDSGRRINRNGGGLSAGARANLKRLQASSADFNALFSLGAGASSTVEGAQQQILALRSQVSESQLARSLRADSGDIAVDDGGVSDSENGQEVDTEA